MLNIGAVLKAIDAVMMFRDAAKRFKGAAPPETQVTAAPAAEYRPGGALEKTLTNVVVAALKEAFDRDHARLELERLQIEEQRRRAEEAQRLELRRQTLDRELGHLRLLAVTALVGFLASILLLVVRLDVMSSLSRVVLVAGWLLLLGALGALFSAHSRATSLSPQGSDVSTASAGVVGLWLLLTGLGAVALSLLV